MGKLQKDHWNESVMDCNLVIASAKYHHLANTRAYFFKILPGRKSMPEPIYLDDPRIDSDAAIIPSNQKERITVSPIIAKIEERTGAI
jgi:hypothetical protein